MSPAETYLLAEAQEIIGMAKSLQTHGQDAEAMEFVWAAALRLQAIRALQDMRQAAEDCDRAAH